MTSTAPRRPRRILAWALLTLLAAAAAAMFFAVDGAAREDSEDHTPTRVRTNLLLPGGGSFEPERLVALTVDGPRIAPLARHIMVEDESRLDLSGFVLGDAITDRPLTAYVSERRVIGGLYRDGDDLIVDLRAIGPPERSRYWPAPVFLVTKPWFVNQVVAARLLRALASATAGAHQGAAAAIAGGEGAPALARRFGAPIGFAYEGDGRLVLGPPRRRLFGRRLF